MGLADGVAWEKEYGCSIKDTSKLTLTVGELRKIVNNPSLDDSIPIKIECNEKLYDCLIYPEDMEVHDEMSLIFWSENLDNSVKRRCGNA